jgi:uncharacterized protein YjiS (DUF1127 family)
MTSLQQTTHPHKTGSLSGELTANPVNGGALAALPMPGAKDRGLGVFVARLVEVTLDWQERRRQRRNLAMMDEHMLRDIGLSSADVEREVHKPFWRP